MPICSDKIDEVLVWLRWNFVSSAMMKDRQNAISSRRHSLTAKIRPVADLSEADRVSPTEKTIEPVEQEESVW